MGQSLKRKDLNNSPFRKVTCDVCFGSGWGWNLVQKYMIQSAVCFVRSIDRKMAAAKSLQWCPTLCDPIDGSPPGSAVPGILQARTLEWVAISFSNAWKWKVKVKSLSRVWPSVTPWTAAFQAPPPMGFSRQEYWSGVPLPSPRKMADLINVNLKEISNHLFSSILQLSSAFFFFCHFIFF